MEITKPNEEDELKSDFKFIVRDDNAIRKSQISKSRSVDSMGSEVDTLFYRLRRLETAKALSCCHLRGSTDRSLEPSKVRFADKVAVKFYTHEPKRSLFPVCSNADQCEIRSEEISATNSILAKKRIPGFASHVDLPAHFVQVIESPIRDSTDLQGRKTQSQEHYRSPLYKSMLKSQIDKFSDRMMHMTTKQRALDTLYGHQCTVLESEVDPPFYSVQLQPLVSEHPCEPRQQELQEVHTSLTLKQNLQNILCCRRWKSQPSAPAEKVVNEEIKNENSKNSRNVSTTSSFSLTTRFRRRALYRSDQEKVKYFQEQKESSKGCPKICTRIMNFLTWK